MGNGVSQARVSHPPGDLGASDPSEIGPFKSLAFRAPTPEVEKMFMASFNATVDSYRALLANVDAGGPGIANGPRDCGR